MGNPLYTYSGCVSWLKEQAVSGVVAPVCSVGDPGSLVPYICSGSIGLARKDFKATLCSEDEFILKWCMCEGHVTIIHLVGVTGRGRGGNKV